MSRLFINENEKGRYNLDDYEIVYYKSIRSYLRDGGTFVDDDVFVSFSHDSPLQFRIDNPEIPRGNLVFVSEKETLSENLDDKKTLIKDDYDFFSGKRVRSKDDDIRSVIQKYMQELKTLTHVFIDAGYYPYDVPENKQLKVDDWMVTFEDPLQALFVMHIEPETSIPRPAEQEFLINPRFRTSITEYWMRVLANFMINNGITSNEEIGSMSKDGKGWIDVEVWDELKEVDIEL
jgi:hypothetical protein